MSNFGHKAVLVLCTFITLQLGDWTRVHSYVLPEPTFQVLSPRGVRVSIPDAPGLQLFTFHGEINKPISASGHGEIAGEVYRANNGRWSYENKHINLRRGDVINYWIYAQTDGLPHRKTGYWTVSSGLDNLISTPSTPQGTLVLEENFDSLNTSLWSRDIKMPLSPDYEFCIYHNHNHEHLVQVQEGRLRIKPLILEDYYGENATFFGRIQLGGCTSTLPAECGRQALSYNILPPVLSARLTTKNHFTLRYGKIEIRAKFPKGDWLYPEMWLEPKYNSYGLGYSSGRVLLGLTRGNDNLVDTGSGTIYDSRKLDFGVRFGESMNVRERIVSKIRETGSKWNEEFHVYTTVWTADGFTFLVDGEEVGSINPEPNGWMPDNSAFLGKKSAPFDQEFYITLGVGAGGVRDFPDNTRSSGFDKPWKNVGAKAMLMFWQAKNQWLPSWRQDSGLESSTKNSDLCCNVFPALRTSAPVFSSMRNCRDSAHLLQ
ncbi:hypothetical protein KM043_002342 [Ampulex compressa]|nr:hypothetical protein KM043_002342 [Ampulex compressa]